jgi:cell division protein FtsZ
LGDRLAVTIISSLTADEDLIPESRDGGTVRNAPAKLPVWEQPQEISPKIEIEPELTPIEVSEPANMIPFEEPAPVETAPPPVEPVLSNPEPIVSPPHKTPVNEEKPSPEKSVQAKQEVLQFEAVTRGRFEKSEPTMVEGEDLDVPTYLRKNIKVK